MAPLGVEPKRRSQEQGDSLDSRLAPKDTPSGLKISATFPPRCVKGGNKLLLGSKVVTLGLGKDLVGLGLDRTQ